MSLEAVADELSLSLGEVQDHYATTHHLLTALIIEAYDSSAAAMEEADAAAEKQGKQPGERLLAAARALRAWAQADLAAFSLIYGSPVPGYDAPPETVPPASRTPAVLARIVQAALISGALRPPSRTLLSAPLIRDEAVAVFGQLPPAPYGELLERGIVLWSSLIGLLSFNVLSRTHDSVRDQDAFFDFGVAVAAEVIGLDVPLPD
ncbi:WHG domain-containing protein [Actinoplanes sp. KI2]|uniref:TetR-like C-terminal domain-containing protein n=1 Tax=Actinoplanes sp. KI2 TaxID=2983315 RepID=UPI0021D5A1F9|nr:WHG domain-containing protein [Actinoplanes sp. KI2]MCU7728903.1 WHG domain-containing protein [Actinoplanes sp. KI2]